MSTQKVTATIDVQELSVTWDDQVVRVVVGPVSGPPGTPGTGGPGGSITSAAVSYDRTYTDTDDEHQIDDVDQGLDVSLSAIEGLSGREEPAAEGSPGFQSVTVSGTDATVTPDTGVTELAADECLIVQVGALVDSGEWEPEAAAPWVNLTAALSLEGWGLFGLPPGEDVVDLELTDANAGTFLVGAAQTWTVQGIGQAHEDFGPSPFGLAAAGMASQSGTELVHEYGPSVVAGDLDLGHGRFVLGGWLLSTGDSVTEPVQDPDEAGPGVAGFGVSLIEHPTDPSLSRWLGRIESGAPIDQVTWSGLDAGFTGFGVILQFSGKPMVSPPDGANLQQLDDRVTELEESPGGGGGVAAIVAGDNVTVDDTDPANPEVSVPSIPAADVTGLATVATSGAYNDLTGKPTIPDSPDDIGAQPVDSDLTAIAALTTTSFGRALLALANAAAGRTAFDAAQSTHTHAQSDVTGLAAALAGLQPIDSDLTAIAALTTTSYGRGLLTLADAAAGRTALDAQQADSDLTAIAGLSPSNDDILQRKSGAWTNRTVAQIKTDLGISSFAETILDDANAAAVRTTIDAQQADAELSAIAGLTSSADKAPYFTGSGTAALMDVSSFARTLVDDADAAAARATLGVDASGTAVLKTVADAKGDLIVGTAADTFARRAVGSNGQVLTADSAETDGVKWATPSGGSSTIPMANVTGGGIIPGVVRLGASTATRAWLANNIYYQPFLPTEDMDLTQLRVGDVTVAGAASSVARILIYASSSSLQPGARIADAGNANIAATSSGQLMSVSCSVTAGQIYLFGFHPSSNVTTRAPQGVLMNGAVALANGQYIYLHSKSLAHQAGADPGVQWDNAPGDNAAQTFYPITITGWS